MKLISIIIGAAALIGGVAAQSCPESEFLFARGTGESGKIGTTVGRSMQTALRRAAGSRMTVVGVEYPANDDFEASSAVGTTWVVEYVKRRAVECPNMKFAFGGYSQGCQVFHKARAGLADPAIQKRIIGAALFGDPYMMATGTLSRVPTTWAGKIHDNCASGDPVCGGGDNFLAHITGYSSSTARSAATFLTDRLEGRPGNAKSPLNGNNNNLPDTTPSTP
ncbi:cutinase-domain-containing protein [Tricharina praecox]|uniref:cutinase-domain-containing protein n=1 Tax=Tricharina praecox TaxID=43433 RepID=UPI00221E6543|nr:cutinase-domain-containing protein [Tricharina praecox]KAI5853805.1 cutinase-domain-containing protein [Tricharina praecox]